MDTKHNIKWSFLKVKQDMLALKQNMTGWIMHFNARDRAVEERLYLLEQRVQELEYARKIQEQRNE
ncbi:hypothetical protein HYW21_08815 [Candidatus Woesearchaeota archaeon]|nr:hypothetical protein [Candidatus Woesearchaeota archaeon]